MSHSTTVDSANLPQVRETFTHDQDNSERLGGGGEPGRMRPGDRASARPGVAAVQVLQIKSRWLPEEFGYVAAGFRSRGKLLAKQAADPGRSWSHITLTYDPKRWESPEACYRASRTKRHVGEFMRRLRLELGADVEYFRVIEFQKNGMPHYHVLADRAWFSHALLMRLWGFGFVFIKPAATEQFRYVSKYITKGIDPPDWLCKFSASIRLASTSRGFWGETAARPASPPSGVKRGTRTIAEIRANPAKHLRCMLRVILDTGEIMFRNANMAINPCLKFLQAAGLEFEPGRTIEGQVDLVAGDPAGVSLEQLLHCGESLGPGAVT